MIPVLDVEQGSEEWMALRCGLPTASNFDKLITSKGKPSTQREKYLYQLAGESITGQKEDSFQSKAMEIGIEREAEARNLYEMLYDVKVHQVGLCYFDDKKQFGCSPDGLIGQVDEEKAKDPLRCMPIYDGEGILEIKCPKMATQVEYIINNKMPTTYIQQVQGQLLVTGAKYADFMSYYPGMPEFIIRVKPDPNVIDPLRDELEKLAVDLKELVKRIKGE